MTKGDGKPCRKCGTSEWDRRGNCKECQRKRHVLYIRRNPERNAEDTSRWRQRHPEKNNAQAHRYKTRKAGGGGSYTAAEFKALCEQYDNRCLACGQKKPLTFDHVIPVIKGGSSDISNGQPLCLSCNSRKGDKTTDYRYKSGLKRWFQKRLL